MTEAAAKPLEIAVDKPRPNLFGRKRRRWFIGTAVAALLIASLCWLTSIVVLNTWDRSCRLAKAESRWADLEAAAFRWSMWQPSAAEPWLFLADAVQHQGRYLEAAEYLARVPQGTPQSLPAHLARCRLLFGPANRPFDGELACRELLKLEPRVTAAHQLLIQFYTVTLQRTKLREQIQAAIELEREPRDAYVYYFLIDSVRLGDGVTLNELWLSSYPDDEVLTVAELLHQDDNLRDDADAISPDQANVLTAKERDARELLPRFPQNTNLLAYLIDQELSKGRLEQVVDLLAEAPVEAEADQRFWRFKGWVHFAREEQEQAIEAYRRALAIHPMDWMTMHRLAEVLRARGETVEVARLEALVKRAHELRVRIRELKSVLEPPIEALREIGRLARDCGDQLVADALTRHLGTLDAPRRNAQGMRL